MVLRTIASRTMLPVWAVMLAVSLAGSAPGQAPAGKTEKEREQLAILRAAAPEGDKSAEGNKALACKMLAIHGSADAVPDLAALLANERLSSWARIALEAIPDPAAGAALRDAAAKLTGRQLVGVIHSLGVRRDAAAVAMLATKLDDGEAAVASAAAYALGMVGDGPATAALRRALPRAQGPARSAVAEGLVHCAERLLAAGKAADATAIYDEVRTADVPRQRKIEATRGAILARGEAGVPLLVEQIRSPDEKSFRLGLTVARELPAGATDRALAEELGKLPPPRAALLVTALADRPKSTDLATLVKAAGAGPREVRAAALTALGQVGNPAAVGTLLAGVTDADADLAAAARAALAELRGAEVDAAIRGRLEKADPALLAVLLELVGQRRIDAVPAAIAAVEHPDLKVRTAALKALGETVDIERLGVLVQQTVKPRNDAEGAAALAALQAASVRMPDREGCAAKLAGALAAAPPAMQVKILEILGGVGGTKALETIATAARSDREEMQDAASRLLGEWMTADAAPVLLDLTKSAPGDKYQNRAMRGYIRIARQFDLPLEQRLEMCRKAWGAARQPAEQKMVLDVLRRYPAPAGLDMAVTAHGAEGLAAEARQAAASIAQKLGELPAESWKRLEGLGLTKRKVEIQKAEYGSGDRKKDVTDTLRKHTGSTVVIVLPDPSFNKVFAGDPAPGAPKQLVIRYLIDGRPGEVTLAEDQAIELVEPK
ncbi:MAG: PBS lyase [Planctomycetia bacterium]|nr:PBS lyase [Planctomycetia bacterium]